MAKRKEEQPNKAEVTAKQRRLKVLSKADGEQLVALLEKAGIKTRKRSDGLSYEHITFEFGSFVTDYLK